MTRCRSPRALTGHWTRSVTHVPLFGAAFALSASAPIFAAVTAADSVPAVRVAVPLPLDPKLTDPDWQRGRITLAPAFENLTTRRITDAGATTAYLLYDERNLYVGFSVRESGSVSATQTTNGTGFGLDDFVGIGIDPSGTGSPVYYFETTPRGTRYQQSSENSRFNPAWQSAAEVVPGGWQAVLIVPLRTMRIGGGGKHAWRINLIREDAAHGEHLTWAYDGLMQDGAVGQAWPAFTDTRFWPALQGVALPAAAGSGLPRPRADIYGLLSMGADRRLFQQGDGSFESEAIRNAGIDASVPLSKTVAFVGTLAPDFSNVEIDQQTIAPQEFARQLVEYRPFFAQGATFLNPNPNPVGGVFAPPNLIFYSPSVGPFDRGAKIEGTAWQNAFGILSFRGYDVTSGNTFDDQAFGYGHARPDGTFSYWSDGVFAHHSIAGDDETAEAGFKGRNLHTGLVYAFDGALERGTALGPNGAHSTNGFVDVHKPNYEVNLTFDDVSPHYGPLDGFTAVSDVRGPQAFVNLVGSGRALKNWTLFAGADRLVDGSGAVHEADAVATLTATFKNQFSIDQLGPTVSELRDYAVPSGPGCSGTALSRSSYSGAPCYRDGRTERYNLFVTNFGYRDGTPAPIDAGYAFGPFGGKQLHQFTTSTSRSLGRRLSASLEYDGSWERSQRDGSLDSQFLRRVSLVDSLDANTTLSLAYRATSGMGGFALPGHNLAIAYHRHATNGDELYVNFGTPAASATLDRFIVKYAVHVGSQPGT